MSLSSDSISSTTLTENTLIAFKKISDFVSNLSEVFGEQFHSVVLYNHLLSKTKFSHKQAIQKHIEIFSDFCFRNQEAILNKNVSSIVQSKISYSDKVYIDIETMLKTVDTDSASQIWNHLIVIQAAIDPTSEARMMLQRLKENSSNEGQFLEQFFEKIESSIDKEKAQTDPMAAASSILQSGVLNDLVGSINNGVKGGQLDLNKLIGTVQGLLGGLNSSSSSSDGGMPDLSGMMGMIGGMMSAMGGTQGLGLDKNGMLSGLNADQLKQQIDKQAEEELLKSKNETTTTTTTTTK